MSQIVVRCALNHRIEEKSALSLTQSGSLAEKRVHGLQPLCMDGIGDRADRSLEKPVRDQPYIRESVVRDETSAAAAGKYCAYNQTRECFLCSDIESGDFPPAALDARLRSLAPGFTKALWLTP